MTKAKQKSTYTKKLLIITLPLILIQAGILYKYKEENKPLEFKDAMNQAVHANSKIDPEQRDVIRINLALNDYRIKNGEYPDSLTKLVPSYFSDLPLDPDTGEAFLYKQTNNSFLLGQRAIESVGVEEKSEEEQVNEEEILLASLNTFNQDIFIYDVTDKRDPFRSYDLSKYQPNKGGETPLEKFDYPAFKLTAVLLDSGEPKAIIEDGHGRGHTIKLGTKIGLYDGVIHEIKEDRIIIMEKTIDFIGEENTRLIEILLPAKESDYGSLSREEVLGIEEKE